MYIYICNIYVYTYSIYEEQPDGSSYFALWELII